MKKTERPDAMRQFVGAVVRIPVAAGEPIRDPAVVFAKGSGFLAAVLTKGMRAVSMEISAENGAGGFILPDDHVDIILTRRDKAAEKLSGVEKFTSEAILRNVRVLAIDQAVEEKAGQKVVVGHTATVELNPDQVETLAVLEKRLLPGEEHPGAVLFVAEIVLEKPLKEKAGLLLPDVLLPKRLSTTLVVGDITTSIMRKVPSVARVLVSQSRPVPGDAGEIELNAPA